MRAFLALLREGMLSGFPLHVESRHALFVVPSRLRLKCLQCDVELVGPDKGRPHLVAISRPAATTGSLCPSCAGPGEPRCLPWSLPDLSAAVGGVRALGLAWFWWRPKMDEQRRHGLVEGLRGGRRQG